MDLQIFVEILGQWKIVVVSLLVMILLPVVFYIASIDKNRINSEVQNTKINSEVAESKEGSEAESTQTSDKEAEKTNEKDNNQGSKGTQS